MAAVPRRTQPSAIVNPSIADQTLKTAEVLRAGRFECGTSKTFKWVNTVGDHRNPKIIE